MNFRNLSRRCMHLQADPGSAELLCRAALQNLAILQLSSCTASCPSKNTDTIWCCRRDTKLRSEPRHWEERGESLCYFWDFMQAFGLSDPMAAWCLHVPCKISVCKELGQGSECVEVFKEAEHLQGDSNMPRTPPEERVHRWGLSKPPQAVHKGQLTAAKDWWW